MNKSKSIIPNGLVGKMISFFAVFALILGFSYLMVFYLQLDKLYKMVRNNEEEELAVLSQQSEESMATAARDNLKAFIKWEADRTDDVFWMAGHSLKELRDQVEDIYRNPDNYAAVDVEGSADEMTMRLMNLEALLGAIMSKDDNYLDIGIVTTHGQFIKMDKNGISISEIDPGKTKWYDLAILRGDTFFYPTYDDDRDLNVIIYVAPVYVDDKLVAVLKGTMDAEIMNELLEKRSYIKSGFTVVVNDCGELLYSSGTFDELEAGKNFGHDIRENVSPKLKDVIDQALGGSNSVTEIELHGQEYYVASGYMRSYKFAQLLLVSTGDILQAQNELMSELKDLSDLNMRQQQKVFILTAVISVISLLAIVVIAVLFVLNIAKRRVRPIATMAEHVAKISKDNMEFKMDDSYKTGDEVQLLAESFEDLSENIKKYVDTIVSIMSEKERVKTELALARRIQADTLPRDFSAFDDRSDFNIYASMTPAKEVGGDFYDFFLLDENKLAVVIADVSGKGIPAAMFMMMAKTLIRSQLTVSLAPNKVLEEVNNLICANNREKMFVTVFLGILDLGTGIMKASNAGHEYPIVKGPDGPFEILKDRHGFVIGGKKNMKYTQYEIVFKPGSKLFVYTDGVPEATNANGELLGMERALQAVNKAADLSPEDILKTVDSEVKEFVGTAEQFDDLTMLCIEYLGK